MKAWLTAPSYAWRLRRMNWGVDTISRGLTHHFFGIENVLVTYYVSAPPADVLRQREKWVLEALKTHEKLALVVVVDARATGALPGREFRDVSKEQADKYRDHIACSAVVLESDTIWFGLLRSFLRGLSLVVRPPFPVRYFSRAEDAGPFVFESCAGPDPDRILRAIESARFAEVAETVPAE